METQDSFEGRYTPEELRPASKEQVARFHDMLASLLEKEVKVYSDVCEANVAFFVNKQEELLDIFFDIGDIYPDVVPDEMRERHRIVFSRDADDEEHPPIEEVLIIREDGSLSQIRNLVVDTEPYSSANPESYLVDVPKDDLQDVTDEERRSSVLARARDVFFEKSQAIYNDPDVRSAVVTHDDLEGWRKRILAFQFEDGREAHMDALERLYDAFREFERYKLHRDVIERTDHVLFVMMNHFNAHGLLHGGEFIPTSGFEVETPNGMARFGILQSRDDFIFYGDKFIGGGMRLRQLFYRSGKEDEADEASFVGEVVYRADPGKDIYELREALYYPASALESVLGALRDILSSYDKSATIEGSVNDFEAPSPETIRGILLLLDVLTPKPKNAEFIISPGTDRSRTLIDGKYRRVNLHLYDGVQEDDNFGEDAIVAKIITQEITPQKVREISVLIRKSGVVDQVFDIYTKKDFEERGAAKNPEMNAAQAERLQREDEIHLAGSKTGMYFMSERELYKEFVFLRDVYNRIQKSQ